MKLVKIFRKAEWLAFQASGTFQGSPDDLRDGFVHLSTGDQVNTTLAAHFAGEAELVLAEVEVGQDPALKWEVSRGGASFPHLYRALQRADVARHEVRP